MVLRIKLFKESGFVLPLHYKSVLQGFIYRMMDSDYGNLIHDRGFSAHDRVFKLFVFSDIEEKARRKGEELMFDKEITFYVASPFDEVLQSMGERLNNEPGFLGKNKPEFAQVDTHRVVIQESKVLVQTISPIIAYHTLLHDDGRKYTDFIEPGHPDFEPLIKENLIRKHLALHNIEHSGEGFSVRPVGKLEVRAQYFRKFFLKGSYGQFVLTGQPELLELALLTGLGAKSAQGFGMVVRID